MKLTDSKIDLADVKDQIKSHWTREKGASFLTTAADGVVWRVWVPAWNRTDCWASKIGTDGKQSRTFCRFNTK